MAKFKKQAMSAPVRIKQILLPAPGIEQMQAETRSEGYKFIDTLVREGASGENLFDAAGEMLCGHLGRGYW